MRSIEEHLAREPANSALKPDQQLLFHYTTFAGFLGIVSGRSMWASSIHYLNDSQEFKHGLDVAKGVAQRKIPDENGARRQLLERFITALQQYSRGYLYVASFTEKGDLLSQWRGYAATGGLSLGFDFGVLRDVAERNTFRLIKCIYDNETKQRIATEIVDSALNGMPSDIEFDASQIEKSAYALVLSYFQLAAAFKDSSFTEESEWRLISRYIPMNHHRVRVRATPRMLIPYYDLPLDLGRTKMERKDIGLELIVVGPSSEQDLISEAVGIATHGQGLWVKSQQYSRIPYRTL
ncbi:DUF2971 domain-containing protein [Sinorhizobium meliloti]|uniref:DUF2971 domain-containing protein n=1 Tax=Rhizobium meliloti TaxID=382 RepID=UPI00129550E1|nr:DUF2971 domain-containing protein [Sinorhizobium meliloti]MQW55664.1 DUF2971 domain-containing protein [Sinorhizobium meliloti]